MLLMCSGAGQTLPGPQRVHFPLWVAEQMMGRKDTQKGQGLVSWETQFMVFTLRLEALKIPHQLLCPVKEMVRKTSKVLYAQDLKCHCGSPVALPTSPPDWAFRVLRNWVSSLASPCWPPHSDVELQRAQSIPPVQLNYRKTLR